MSVKDEWTTPKGMNMPVIGQPTYMECWIVCYEMMLKANGIYLTRDQIEKRMTRRGLGEAKTLRYSGLDDLDLAKCGTALGAGQKSTSSINTLSGLQMMLQTCGPLWVAGRLEGKGGVKYKHIIMAIGVDMKDKRVQTVNPWVNGMYDSPTKAWMWWWEFQAIIKTTLNVPGSLQYLTPIQAASIAVAP